jgi:hypothetical protein
MSATRAGHSDRTKLEILLLLTLWRAHDCALNTEAIYRRVEARYGHILTHRDLHGDVRTERWLWNALRFAKNSLRLQGLVTSVARGRWALTAEGRAYLRSIIEERRRDPAETQQEAEDWAKAVAEMSGEALQRAYEGWLFGRELSAREYSR